MELVKKGTAPFNVRGSNNLTTFDPIKDAIGYKDSLNFNGSPRNTILSASSGTVVQGGARVFNAKALPSVGPGSGRVARSTPSLPRRNYQPTVLT